jgi:transposase
VSHQIVSDWRTVWRRYGRDGLYGAGRRPKLGADRLDQIEAALANGPEANGYTTDLWTLKRVAEVIEQVSGVAYHPAHVWHLLRERLGWTWQRPARRAVERNDAAIERWVKQRWPQIKKKGTAPERADRVRRRVRGVIIALGASDLGAQGAHTRAAPPLQLETAVPGRCTRVWNSMAATRISSSSSTLAPTTTRCSVG